MLKFFKSTVLVLVFLQLFMCPGAGQLAAAPAQTVTPSFVADAIQAAPGLEVRSGRLYVSSLGTRFEFMAKKHAVIQIIRPALGLFRLLFPETRTYFEISSQSASRTGMRGMAAPCSPSPQVQCIKEGEEMLAGLPVERWIARPVGQQAKKAAGKNSVIVIWWDPARKRVVRQLFADGSEIRAKMIGSMTFEGRRVEQWKTTLSRSGGGNRYSYMLFAPDLNFPVMQQGVNGLVKELHNIRLMKIDKTLFQIPAGYRKIAPVAKAP